MTKTARVLAAIINELAEYEFVKEEISTGVNFRFTKRGDGYPTLFVYLDTKRADGRHALIVTYPKTQFVLHILDGTRHPITVTGKPTRALTRALVYALDA
jgi:hypothetical protein